MRGAPGRLRAATAALVACCALQGALGARGDVAPPDAARDFVRILESVGAETGSEAIDQRAERLAAVPGAAGLWLACASTAGAALTPGRTRLLQRAAPLLDGRDVLELLSAEAADTLSAAGRRGALELLSHHGTARELDLALSLGAPREGEDPGVLLESFEETAESIFRRDVGAFDELRPRSLPGGDFGLALVRAAGRSQHARGLDWLGALVDDPELGGAALVELGRLATLTRGARAKLAIPALRKVLEGSDESRRRHAMRALAELGDAASIPELVRALEGAGPTERAAAHRALETLTGCGFAADPGPWRAWFLEERRWWYEDSRRVFDGLESEDEERVVGSLAELSRHRLRRDALAEAAARGLLHDAPGVRASASVTLGRLGSDVAVADLVRALDDPEPEVRERVLSALKAITGEEHPADRLAWEEAVLGA